MNTSKSTIETIPLRDKLVRERELMQLPAIFAALPESVALATHFNAHAMTLSGGWMALSNITVETDTMYADLIRNHLRRTYFKPRESPVSGRS